MKNPNGYGSVICLDKTGKRRRKPWAVRITVGFDESGKQLTKYLGYYKSQKEATIALAQYHMIGLDVDATTLTVEDVFEQWLKSVEHRMTPQNQRSYRAAFRLVGSLAKKRFKDLKSNHLQTALDSVKRQYNTKKKVRSMLKQVWEYGLKNDYVLKNYASGLELEGKQEDVGKVFTAQEIDTLWQHADDYHIQLVLVMIYTGVRANELLKINTVNTFLSDHYFITGSKTDAGKDRIIPIHDAILPFVQNIMSTNHHLAEFDGHGVHYNTLYKWFGDVMTRFGFDHKLHDTRKTTVSLLHSAEVPIETIRFVVGHAQQGITAQVYLKKTAAELVAAVNKIPV